MAVLAEQKREILQQSLAVASRLQQLLAPWVAVIDGRIAQWRRIAVDPNVPPERRAAADREFEESLAWFRALQTSQVLASSISDQFQRAAAAEEASVVSVMGWESTRLLVAGLQRCAAEKASLILIDEVEHGLEPHRILRFLATLGAKENAPLQVLMTTHSPVVIRELGGDQLFIVRRINDSHVVEAVGVADEIQGTIRLFPEALLAHSTLVCEGASEVGLVRGLDQYHAGHDKQSMTACNVGTIDGGSNTFKRALALRKLGYHVAVLRDSDVDLGAEAQAAESEFKKVGGQVFMWREGEALEDEMFLSLSDDAVDKLLDKAQVSWLARTACWLW
jgi:hypothetical protein